VFPARSSGRGGRLLRRDRLLLTALGEPAMSAPPIARRDIAALVLAATCWGAGTVISKAALDEIPPVTLLPIQLAGSLVVLSILLRRRGVALRTEGATLLGRLGLLNPGIAYALGLLGLTSITASLSVLLWVTEPLLILVLAAWFLRERLSAGQAILSLIAVGGMVLVLDTPSIADVQWVGVGLTMAGVACCAAYTVIARRSIGASPETGPVIVAQQAYALAFALGLMTVVAIAGGDVIPSAVTPIGLASALGSGVLYYAAAYWFYLGALRRVPAPVAAMSFYLIPIVGVAGGTALLGDRLGPTQLIGAAVVVGALLASANLPSARTAGAIRVS
jgi:drug/metabolite transporter (DMT)-like permease